jgi:SAM-dependent methyltransferase
MSAFLKSYGPSNVKKLLWDREFSSSKWDFIDDTAGDCVYPHLEKYAKGGSILDLGCGPGNTANELAETAYRTYIGLDISEAALAKAAKRSEQNGRAEKNHFVQSDFLSYLPTQEFDVILFRESLYHVPLGQVKVILEKYSKYLKDSGVFIVRIAVMDSRSGKTGRRPMAMVGVIEAEFSVVEKCQHPGPSGPTVIVFQPRHRG